MANTGGHADKDNYVDSGNVPNRDQDGREGFGDDGGTRVGKPDAAREAAPSTNTDDSGLEGSILDGEDSARDTSTRATGSRGGQLSEGGGQSRVQQASHGAGSEAAEGVRGAGAANQDKPNKGAADGERAGSEPLDRSREHKGGYGGEGGAPRTSSDQREPTKPT